MTFEGKSLRVAIFVCAGSAALLAQSAPDSDPTRALRRLVPRTEQTQVMVLGTFHFREIQDRYRASMAEPLLEGLTAFKPDVIAVEQLPGAHVHELELRSRATSIHEECLRDYADAQLELGHDAQRALGQDMIQASHALTSSGHEPPAGAVRVLTLLAAYEYPSALLAWSEVGEREAVRSQLPSALVGKLDLHLSRVNEVQKLAIPLARRRGLQVIAGVDEFEDPVAMEAILPGLLASAKEDPHLAAAGKAEIYRESERLKAAAVTAGDLLPFFRFLNSSAFAAADVNAQWGVFLRTRWKGGEDRARLALWENRNLKIAARIRALSSRHPGKRILVIFGAAHKPFLEAYLRSSSDISMVPVESFLRGSAGERRKPH